MTTEKPMPAYVRDAWAALQKGKLMIDPGLKTKGLTAYRAAVKYGLSEDWQPDTYSPIFMGSGIDWLVNNGLATNSLGLIELSEAGSERVMRKRGS